MNRIWTLVTAPARGQRRWQIAAALVVVALAPFAVVLTLLPQRGASPAVPVAIVNLDTPVSSDGSYVAVGKLLTQNLVSAHAVDWVLTDTATAASGLSAGDYLAVVTIPADFSATTMTLSTPTPSTSSLTVQTTTAHGYLGGVVAQALAAGIPAGVSAQLTQQYVTGTLSAFAKLGEGIGQAASGAHTISGGLGQATQGAQALATGSSQLADGLGTIDRVLAALPDGARGLGRLTEAGAAASADLSWRLLGRAGTAAELDLAQDVQVDALQQVLDAIAADPTADAETLRARVQSIHDGAKEIDRKLQGQGTALAGDAATAGEVAIGAAAISAVSAPVAEGLGELARAQGAAASGAQQIASGNQALAQGLGQLTSGSAQLATGLGTAADGIPDYTSAQQQRIAQVVATPIAVQTRSTGGPDSGTASVIAALAPVAQWLGAIATFLIVAPFARGALTSAAPAWRIARDGAVVVTAVAAVQALLVWGSVVLSGAASERVWVAGALALVTALSFALVHQALVSFLPRAGLIVSIVLLGLQVAAAGTLSPQALSPAASGPLSLLPLSIALQAAQQLVGGSLHGVLGAAVGLVIWGVLGALGTIVGVRRARSRSVSTAQRFAAGAAAG